MREISQTVGDLSLVQFNTPDDCSASFSTSSHACFFLFVLTGVFARFIIQHRETSYRLCDFFILTRGDHVIWTALGGPENQRFFCFYFRLQQSTFHWIIRKVVRKWERSDSSYSDSVELVTPLTTPIFEGQFSYVRNPVPNNHKQLPIARAQTVCVNGNTFNVHPDKSPMIAYKTQKIEKILSLRLVCDEKQRKSEEATTWQHNRKLFLIICDQSATIFMHVIRFDESEESISDENSHIGRSSRDFKDKI